MPLLVFRDNRTEAPAQTRRPPTMTVDHKNAAVGGGGLLRFVVRPVAVHQHPHQVRLAAFPAIGPNARSAAGEGLDYAENAIQFDVLE